MKDLKMNAISLLKTIPYWDEDDDDELPEGITYGISEVVPVAGNKPDNLIFMDYSNEFRQSCFAERL